MISIAPGERQRPCTILREKHQFDINFPCICPDGKGGLHNERRLQGRTADCPGHLPPLEELEAMSLLCEVCISIDIPINELWIYHHIDMTSQAIDKLRCLTPPPWRSLSRCMQATPAAPVARTTASLQGIRWGLAAMWTLEELPMRSPGSTWSIAGTGPCWWGLWTWSIGWFALGLYDHSWTKSELNKFDLSGLAYLSGLSGLSSFSCFTRLPGLSN